MEMKKKNEVEKFCGWVLQCKTEEKVKKINFYKFILVYWKMTKKNGYKNFFFFFGVFQSSSKMKKIIIYVYMFLGDFPTAKKNEMKKIIF